MIKVCHLTSAHDSQDNRIFLKECQSLAQYGRYEVFLIAPGETKDMNGVHIVGIEKISGGRYARMTKTTKHVYNKAIEVNADIYHFHDPELMNCALKLKKMGKKVIYDAHEDYPLNILEKHWIPKFLRPIVSLVVKACERYLSKKIDVIISVTPQIVNRFKLWNNNAYLITNYPIVENIEMEEEPQPENDLCFAGSIAPSRLHHSIIRALEKTEGVQYSIAGHYSPPTYLDELKKFKAFDRVNYLGEITYKEVIKLYRSSKIGIVLEAYSHTNYMNEGSLGVTKLFEYMLTGLPVICTNFLFYKEIIDEYKCGICLNPNNIDDIAEAINYLIKNPDVAKTMGINGRRAVLEKYNWATEEIKLLNIYIQLEKQI